MSVLCDQMRAREKWRMSHSKATRAHDLVVALLEYALLILLIWCAVTYRARVHRAYQVLRSAVCQQSSPHADQAPSA